MSPIGRWASMVATDLFAESVGMDLAEHCGIFNDPNRREKLIACLIPLWRRVGQPAGLVEVPLFGLDLGLPWKELFFGLPPTEEAVLGPGVQIMGPDIVLVRERPHLGATGCRDSALVIRSSGFFIRRKLWRGAFLCPRVVRDIQCDLHDLLGDDGLVSTFDPERDDQRLHG